MSIYNHEQQKLSVCKHIPDGAQTTQNYHPHPLDGDKSASMSSGPMDLFLQCALNCCNGFQNMREIDFHWKKFIPLGPKISFCGKQHITGKYFKKSMSDPRGHPTTGPNYLVFVEKRRRQRLAPPSPNGKSWSRSCKAVYYAYNFLML